MGVFGGTFDPPHLGHLILASEAIHQFNLDKILFIISADPPHKRNNEITSPMHRIKMLSLATEENTAFEISKIDLERPGPHFAVDTMKILCEEKPTTNFVYLMGEDSLHDLPNWGRPHEFLNQCHRLGVMVRSKIPQDISHLLEVFPTLPDKLNWLKTPNFDIASRDIRNRIRKNIPVQYFLPHKVNHYIKENNLYR